MIDTHAIGWIVTRDLCIEAARTFLGLQPRLERGGLEQLSTLWLRLASAVRADQRTMSVTERILRPRRTPLSKKSEEAMKAFAERLVASYPGLYGHQTLRNRCFGGCVQLIASFFCCLMVAHHASPEIPMLGWASLCFFLVGCWSLVATFQLFVACRLIDRLGADHAPRPASRRSGWLLPWWRNRR